MAIDYVNPDYREILVARADKLAELRSKPEGFDALKKYYSTHPWDFISDWGMTYDPRNIERGLPAFIPFVPFEKQVEFLKWLYERWQSSERGMGEKSRDMGVSWLAVGFSVSMWLFRDGFSVGFGSRKEEYVDKKGDPKSIFEKIRPFIASLPVEFRPKGYSPNEHATYMRILNPENGASIVGEAGDNIGRGGRCSIYFVDEAAFVANQDSVDAALSQTTNCQIDISTPNGNGNTFYRKRHGGKVKVFSFNWMDDPRKNSWTHPDGRSGSGRDAPIGAVYPWYEKQVAELDEIIVAQEIDCDYNASAENVFISAKWVNAAVDAHVKLGFEPTGIKAVAFDPADTGDAKARCYRHGSVILEAAELKTGDTRDAVPWVRDYVVSKLNLDAFAYDADGMGAPIIKHTIEDEFVSRKLPITAFRGSAKVATPKVKVKELDRNAEDAFANYRAQSCYALRRRFEKTYDAVVNGVYGYDPEELISISSSIGCIDQMKSELSRPQRKHTGNGKILVESKKEMKSRGVASPNLFDVVNMAMDEKGVRAKKSVEIAYGSQWS